MSSAEEIRDALRRFPRRGIRRWESWRGRSPRAAVAVTIVTDGNAPAVLLTRRADGLHELPGLPTDPRESRPDAARRALAEQLGMGLPPGSVLGMLDDYQTRSGLAITPVLVWAGERGEPRHRRPARHDVQVVAVSFADLDVEPVFVAGADSDDQMIRLPLHGEWLHAPTAAILYQFREAVLHHRPTRVAHLTAAPLLHSAGSAGLFG
ncbi:MAG: NUDIX domain-containing protein [Pseudonocardiaceae bacterium]